MPIRMAISEIIKLSGFSRLVSTFFILNTGEIRCVVQPNALYILCYFFCCVALQYTILYCVILYYIILRCVVLYYYYIILRYYAHRVATIRGRYQCQGYPARRIAIPQDTARDGRPTITGRYPAHGCFARKLYIQYRQLPSSRDTPPGGRRPIRFRYAVWWESPLTASIEFIRRSFHWYPPNTRRAPIRRILQPARTLYQNILYYIAIYYIIAYYIILLLYYVMLYHIIILHYIILYYVTPPIAYPPIRGGR